MKSTLSLLLLLLTLGGALSPVFAANQEGPPKQNLLPPQSEEAEPPVSRRQASDLARESYPGKVLSIRLEASTWRVRLDQEGTVSDVFVDSRSGKVSRAAE